MNVKERPNKESYNNYINSENQNQRADIAFEQANTYNEFGITTDKIGEKGELGRVIKGTFDELFDKLAIMRKALYSELDSCRAMAINDNNNLATRINNLDVMLRQDIVNAKDYFYESLKTQKKTCIENTSDIYGKIHRRKNDSEESGNKIKQDLEDTKSGFFTKLSKLEKLINEAGGNESLVTEIKKIEKNCDDKSEQCKQSLTSNYKELEIKINAAKKQAEEHAGQVNGRIEKLQQDIISEMDGKLEVLYKKVIAAAVIPLQTLETKLSANITEIENKIKPFENIEAIKAEIELEVEKKVGKKLQDKLNSLIEQVENLNKFVKSKFDDYALSAIDEPKKNSS